jgi:hypothetical protein
VAQRWRARFCVDLKTERPSDTRLYVCESRPSARCQMTTHRQLDLGPPVIA